MTAGLAGVMLMDFGAAAGPASAARAQRQYTMSATGRKYSAVMGKTKFITVIDCLR